ncbi:MAG: hypothetical protein ACFFBE_11560 [Promethearchaeota archaeon]
MSYDLRKKRKANINEITDREKATYVPSWNSRKTQKPTNPIAIGDITK